MALLGLLLAGCGRDEAPAPVAVPSPTATAEPTAPPEPELEYPGAEAMLDGEALG